MRSLIAHIQAVALDAAKAFISGPEGHAIISETLNRPGAVLKREVFRNCVAAELMKTDPRLSRGKAESMASVVVDDLVKDTGGYAHLSFAWDRAAAITAAHEYEIRFWEPSDA